MTKMDGTIRIRPIARIENDFDEKFGIPRQSGLVEAVRSRVVFEPAFRNAHALKGLDEYSHIWLIWQFSRAVRRNKDENMDEEAGDWSPTVRPPRLGGDVHMGVFATRSPFRPNPLGLSCVRLEGIVNDEIKGPCLIVSGADLLNGTPIYDIKPYLPYADLKADATGGFTDRIKVQPLKIVFPPALLAKIPEEKRPALAGVLAQDPRPGYHDDPERVYGMLFGGYDVRFTVDRGILTVCEVRRMPDV